MLPLLHQMLQKLPAYATSALALLLLLLTSGCIASNPLSIPDEEWSQLSPEQQLQAYHQQAELDKIRIQTRAQERQAELAAEAELKQQQLMLRRHARYGDIVQCVLDPIQARFSSKWKAAQPLAFDLVRGESIMITLRDQQGRYQRKGWVSFDAAGQSVSVCRQSSKYGLNDCDQLLGTTRELHRGIQQQLDIEDYARGTLRCDLKPTP